MILVIEENNSILYVNAERTQLIEKDMISGKKYLRYKTNGSKIVYGNIVKGDTVINLHNNYKHTILINNHIVWNTESRCYVSAHNINNQSCIIFTEDFKSTIYLARAFLKKLVTGIQNYDISEDSMRIIRPCPTIYAQSNIIYVKNISDVSSIFDFEGTIHCINIEKLYPVIEGFDVQSTRWIQKSSRIALVELFSHYTRVHKKIMVNVDTGAIKNIDLIFTWVDIGRYLIGSGVSYIELIDPNCFVRFNRIECGFELSSYSMKFGLLISHSLDYYQINSNYEIEKIMLGKNYITDRSIIKIDIMEIVLEYNLIFALIPMEILCIELYCQILLMNLHTTKS